MTNPTPEQRVRYTELRKARDAAFEEIRPALAALEVAEQAICAPKWTPADKALEEFIETDLEGEEPFDHCEGCEAPIFEDDAYAADPEEGIRFCEACAKQWREEEAAKC